MARNVLKIVAKLVNEISKEAKAIQKDVEGINASSKVADKGLGNLGDMLEQTGTIVAAVGVGLTAFSVAAKKAFEFTEEGAQLRQLEESFLRTGLSIDAMREAARGTIDDTTLMAGTLTLVAGASENLQSHLLDNAPQLMEIAKAANTVNPLLGDTAYMYESIATGIKRGSPLILDNLGIVVKVGEANERYAESIGKAVTELTAEEKQIALLNETLEAGNRLIEQAGGSTESFADGWAQVRAEMANVTGEAKEHAAVIAGPLMTAYGDFLRWSRDTDQSLIGVGASLRMVTKMMGWSEDAIKVANIAWLNASGQYDKVGEQLADLFWRTEDATEATKEHTDAVKDLDRAQKGLTESREDEIRRLEAMAGSSHRAKTMSTSLADASWRQADAVIDSAEAWDQYSRALEWSEEARAKVIAQDNLERQLQREADALARVQQAYSDLSTAMGSGLTEENRAYQEQQEELHETLGALEAELYELEHGHGRMVVVENKHAMTTAELNLATLQLADAQAKLNEEQDPLRAAKLATKVEDLQGKIAAATGSQTAFIDNSKRMAEVRAEIAATEEEVAALAAAHEEATGRIVFGFAEQEAAADGVITQEEYDFLAELGRQYGLLDEAAATALESVKKEMDDVRSGTQDALGAVQDLRGEIYKVEGKTVTIRVKTEYDQPFFNPGANRPMMNAEGGVSAGGWSLVGERGPEMRYLPPGSRVMSNEVTNNYNLTMHTRETRSSVLTGFALMRALG